MTEPIAPGRLTPAASPTGEPAEGSEKNIDRAVRRLNLGTANPLDANKNGPPKRSWVKRFLSRISPTSIRGAAEIGGVGAAGELQAAPKGSGAGLLEAGNLLIPEVKLDAAELQRQRSALAASAAYLVEVLTGTATPGQDAMGAVKSGLASTAAALGFAAGVSRGLDPDRAAQARRLLEEPVSRRAGAAAALEPLPTEDRLSKYAQAAAALARLESDDNFLRRCAGTSASAPEGTPLSESVQRGTAAIEAGCRQWTTEFVQQHIVGRAEGPLADRLREAAARCTQRLDSGQPVVDAGHLEMLVLVGLQGTAPGSVERAQALEGLLETNAALLVQQAARAVARADAATPGEQAAAGHSASSAVPDPVHRLADNLIEEIGGVTVIQRLAGIQPQEKEPVRVALLAARACRDAEAGGTLSGTQARWLRSAVAQAEVQLELRDVSADQQKTVDDRAVAFSGVGMGYYSTDPGSRYAQVRDQLLAHRDEGMFRDVGSRNMRSGTTVGDLRNYASSVMPQWPAALKAIAPPATTYRKSAFSRQVKVLQDTRRLRPREVVLESLHHTAAHVRDALVSYADSGQATAAEQLLLGVLKASGLGLGESGRGPGRTMAPVPEWRSLKNLDDAFFRQVEAQVPELKSLPDGLQAEWAGLAASKPNIAHVLSLLREHVDVASLLAGQAPTHPSPGQAAKTREMLAARMVDAYAPAVDEFKQLVDGQKLGAQAESVAVLLEATVGAMSRVRPAANLLTLGADQYGAVEGGVAELYKARLKARGAADAVLAALSGPAAFEAARAEWPLAVRAHWDQCKSSNQDAGRLLSAIGDSAASLSRSDGVSGAKGKGVATAADRFIQALQHAREAGDTLERQVRAAEFAADAADAVTVYRDIRHARHAADANASMTRTAVLGDVHNIRVGPTSKLSPTAGPAGVAIHTVSPVVPVLSREVTDFVVRELASTSSGLQLTLLGGVQNTKEFGLMAGYTPFEIESHPAETEERQGDSNLALGASAQALGATERASFRGTVIRADRFGPHDDADQQVRLTQAVHVAYRAADPLDALLRVPGITVTPVETEGFGGGVRHRANARLAVKTGASADPEERMREQKVAGFSLEAGATLRAFHANQRLDETGSQGQRTRQVATSALRDDGAMARAVVGASLLPADKQTTAARPFLPVASVDGSVSYASWRDEILRITTRRGEMAPATQIVMSFKKSAELIDYLKTKQLPALIEGLMDQDPHKSDPEPVRAQRALGRATELLADFARQDSPNTTFLLVANGRPADAVPRVGQASAIAHALSGQGRAEGAGTFREGAQRLLASETSYRLAGVVKQQREGRSNARTAGVVLFSFGSRDRVQGLTGEGAAPWTFGQRAGTLQAVPVRDRLIYDRSGNAAGMDKPVAPEMPAAVGRLTRGVPEALKPDLQAFLQSEKVAPVTSTPAGGRTEVPGAGTAASDGGTERDTAAALGLIKEALTAPTAARQGLLSSTQLIQDRLAVQTLAATMDAGEAAFRDAQDASRLASAAERQAGTRCEEVQRAEAAALENLRRSERDETTAGQQLSRNAAGQAEFAWQGTAAGKALPIPDASDPALTPWMSAVDQAQAAGETVAGLHDALQATGAEDRIAAPALAAYRQAALAQATGAMQMGAPAVGESSQAAGQGGPDLPALRAGLLTPLQDRAHASMEQWIQAVDGHAALMARVAWQHPLAVDGAAPVLDIRHADAGPWLASAAAAVALAREDERASAALNDAQVATVALQGKLTEAQTHTRDAAAALATRQAAAAQCERELATASEAYSAAVGPSAPALHRKMAAVEVALAAQRQQAAARRDTDRLLDKANLASQAAAGDAASLEALERMRGEYRDGIRGLRTRFAELEERRQALRTARQDPAHLEKASETMALYVDWSRTRKTLACAEQEAAGLDELYAKGEKQRRDGALASVRSAPMRREQESRLATQERENSDRLRIDLRDNLARHPAGFHANAPHQNLDAWERLQAASGHLMSALAEQSAVTGDATAERRQFELMQGLSTVTKGDAGRAAAVVEAVLAQPAAHWIRSGEEVARLDEDARRLHDDVVAWHAQQSALPGGLEDLLSLSRPGELAGAHAVGYFSAARMLAQSANRDDEAWAAGALDAISHWVHPDRSASLRLPSEFDRAAGRGFMLGIDRIGPGSAAAEASRTLDEILRGHAPSPAQRSTGPFGQALAELEEMTKPGFRRELADKDVIAVAKTVRELVTTGGGAHLRSGARAGGANLIIELVCDHIIHAADNAPDLGFMKRLGRTVRRAMPGLKPPKDYWHPSAETARIGQREWRRILPAGARMLPAQFTGWCELDADGMPVRMRSISPIQALKDALKLLGKEEKFQHVAEAAGQKLNQAAELGQAFQPKRADPGLTLARALVRSVTEQQAAAAGLAPPPESAPVRSGQQANRPTIFDVADAETLLPSSDARQVAVIAMLKAALDLDQGSSAKYPNAIAAVLGELPESAFQASAELGARGGARSLTAASRQLLKQAGEMLQRQPGLPAESAQARSDRQGKALQAVDALLGAFETVVGRSEQGRAAASAAAEGDRPEPLREQMAADNQRKLAGHLVAGQVAQQPVSPQQGEDRDSGNGRVLGRWTRSVLESRQSGKRESEREGR